MHEDPLGFGGRLSRALGSEGSGVCYHHTLQTAAPQGTGSSWPDAHCAAGLSHTAEP